MRVTHVLAASCLPWEYPKCASRGQGLLEADSPDAPEGQLSLSHDEISTVSYRVSS